MEKFIARAHSPSTRRWHPKGSKCHCRWQIVYILHTLKKKIKDSGCWEQNKKLLSNKTAARRNHNPTVREMPFELWLLLTRSHRKTKRVCHWQRRRRRLATAAIRLWVGISRYQSLHRIQPGLRKDRSIFCFFRYRIRKGRFLPGPGLPPQSALHISYDFCWRRFDSILFVFYVAGSHRVRWMVMPVIPLRWTYRELNFHCYTFFFTDGSMDHE